MNLIARSSGGGNLVGRPQALRPWYPGERVRPVRAEVYWRYSGEVAAAAYSLGQYAPGQAVVVPFKGKLGVDVILSVVSISPNGVPSVRELGDAQEHLIAATMVRKATAPFEDRLRDAPSRHAGRPTVPTGVRFPREGGA